MSSAAALEKWGCSHHVGRFDLGWKDVSRCYKELTVMGEGTGKGLYSQAFPSFQLPSRPFIEHSSSPSFEADSQGTSDISSKARFEL